MICPSIVHYGQVFVTLHCFINVANTVQVRRLIFDSNVSPVQTGSEDRKDFLASHREARKNVVDFVLAGLPVSSTLNAVDHAWVI